MYEDFALALLISLTVIVFGILAAMFLSPIGGELDGLEMWESHSD
jgi:hypothetical protein